MQTHLIYGKKNSLLKYVAYEEELNLEIKALLERLNNCKLLREQQVGWNNIKSKLARACSKKDYDIEKIRVRGTLRSAPHRHERKFSAIHVCRIVKN